MEENADLPATGITSLATPEASLVRRSFTRRRKASGYRRVLEAFEPDVVVADLSLPIASGFDVLNELRAAPRTQNTPVIAISGNDRGLKLAKANPEFFATIQKPFDPETLVRVVDRARRHSQN